MHYDRRESFLTNVLDNITGAKVINLFVRSVFELADTRNRKVDPVLEKRMIAIRKRAVRL